MFSEKSFTLKGVNDQTIFSQTIRRLTPLECERLQGFPDGWTDEQSDSQRYKQMGNAVTVNVAKWIGDRIVDSYGK
jgi:site-specific DNA-cytosine methylase